MQEAFLHFLWKLQYFDFYQLKTECGQDVEVLQPGLHNQHAGPDFSFAKIRIGGILWAGHVEIHIKSGDWLAHQHQNDPAYNNVILHVVWEHNTPHVKTKEGLTPPVLTLKERVSETVLNNYQSLLQADRQVPCATFLPTVPAIYKDFMLEKALAERIEKKAEKVNALLHANKNDWEQTAYQVLMKAMGFKHNGAAFEKLAANLLYKVIKKQEQLLQVEALLFGQAGFLSAKSPLDAYQKKLQGEYKFLRAKYKLSRGLSANEWHFMRLRPANFPTLRLAQIAAVLFNYKNLMSLFTEAASKGDKQLFKEIKQARYWQLHYHFGKKYSSELPFIGRGSQQVLMINVAAPLLVARSAYLGNEDLYSLAMELLNGLKPEKNSITQHWETLGLKAKTAYESQALIELHQNYCLPKRCLSCRIGAHLMKKDFASVLK